MEMQLVDLSRSEIRCHKLGIVIDPFLDGTLYDPYLPFCGFINDSFLILIIDLKIFNKSHQKALV